MAETQELAGFVLKLLGEGVTVRQLESALRHAENLIIGKSIVNSALPDVPMFSESSDALINYGFATANRLKGLL